MPPLAALAPALTAPLTPALSPQFAFAEAYLGAVDPDRPPALCLTAVPPVAAVYLPQALAPATFGDH